MIARPTAASAAATAITKNTKIWPATPSDWASATNVRFTALSISSTHMKMTIALRRNSTPATPRANSTAETASDGPRSIQSFRFASTTAPTIAASNSTLVISKGMRYWENSGRATAPTIPCSCCSCAITLPPGARDRTAPRDAHRRSHHGESREGPEHELRQRHRSLPPGIRGVPQRRDGVRLRAQALEIVDEPVARVLGILVMHADVDGLLGADLLAVATEHAAEFVDLVDQGVAVALLVLARHQLDAVGGADLRAQAARYALRAPLLVGEHAVRAAPAGRDRPVLGGLLFRVLHRDLRLEQVPEGERHALEGRAHVGRGRARPLHHLHPDCHQTSPSARATEPEMMRPRSSHQNNSPASTALSPNSAQLKPGP